MEYFRSDKFKARVEGLLEKHRVPGLAIALVHNETVESAAFGLATLDPPTPCTPDTLFDIASASKSMTAASVALLVEDANHPEVQYDAVVSQLLPGDFVMATDEYTNNVTLDDILGHRSGYPRHDRSYLGVNAAQPDSAQSVTRNVRNLPPAHPIRTKFMYNNIMYTVAAYLVENKSGQTFSDWLESRFFKPLDMASSSLQPSRARAKGFGHRMAHGYTWDSKKKRQVQLDILECQDADGAGCIITSVNDYIKWVKAMMHQQGPVTEAVYKSMLRARSITNPDGTELPPQTSPVLYAAGLELSYYRGNLRVSHAGGVTGFSTKQFFIPGQKFGGVITCNSDSGSVVGSVLVDELIDEMLQVPDAERPDWHAFETAFEGEDEEEEDIETLEAKVRKEMLGNGKTEPEPLTRDLESYAGRYWNAGYHDMVVQIKDGKLFVDASERSFGFTAVLSHVASQTKFTFRTADSEDWGGLDSAVSKAEFKVEEGKVAALGVDLEHDLVNEWIWFSRQQD
ncbi:hypothetical protein AK830_g5561 [Neonectria ditissima]|uniref:Beta-lactamase-related domain-containing protein n=1 Tax=Neonectria ditissima TaxID=78410 RepID=A0A0P7B3R2_9HYPO|nr:hypothetical protein AK830_g5561 [Neonectria ditissima]